MSGPLRDLHPGAESESDRPCTRTSWCLLEIGHEGSCVEVPRAKHAPPDLRVGQPKPRSTP